MNTTGFQEGLINKALNFNYRIPANLPDFWDQKPSLDLYDFDQWVTDQIYKLVKDKDLKWALEVTNYKEPFRFHESNPIERAAAHLIVWRKCVDDCWCPHCGSLGGLPEFRLYNRGPSYGIECMQCK